MIKPYSDWFRIDLHIHTDWSKKTKDNDYRGDFSVEILREKLIDAGVKVFSLTDHNIINIEAYKEYYRDYDPDSEPLLLVGVELDIIVETDTPKTYHTLIIFNYSSEDKAQYVHDRLEGKYAELRCDIKDRTLKMDDVINIFPDDDFFFIPHAGNKKGIISPYKDNLKDAQCMIILMQSAMEKVKEQRRYQYNLGFDNVLTEAFQNRNDHAYIEFSDNHCIQSYPYPSNSEDALEHSFYYVKGGKNFETLRQAFIDPISRIKSSIEYSRIKSTPRFLESLKIENLPLFDDNEIVFSPHLNVIIGGRSSGKSLLMFILGQKIDSTSGDATDYNVELSKIQIKAIQNAEYCHETSILNKKITYIKQGEIVNYFESKNLQDLTKNTDTYDQYKEAKSAFRLHKQKLESAIEDLVSSYRNCESFASQTFVLHNSTIDSILSDSFTISWEEEEVRNHFNLTDKIDNESSILEELIISIEKFKNCELFDLDTKESTLVEEFSLLVKSKTAIIKKKEDQNSTKHIFLNCVSDLIDDRNGQLTNEAQLKNEAKQSLRDFKTRVRTDFEHLSELKRASLEFTQFDYSLMEEFGIHEDITMVLESKNNDTERIIDLFLDGIKDCNHSLGIYRNLLNLMHGKVSIKNYGNVSSNTLRKKTYKQLEGIFEAIDSPNDYLNYADGETSLDKSPGYNSEKYLEIILSNTGTELVFIDQPEDNLGNTFITTTLVDMIRKIKFHKQIFLVTHNPSLVVHGDAENVIISANNEKVISYRQIVIENEKSQKEICQILDGGEYIFHNRSQKYNIQRLIKGNSSE